MVKSEENIEAIEQQIAEQAKARYPVIAIVKKYLESIEEIINIPVLLDIFEQVLKANKGDKVIEEIILQSRVEFNVEAEETDILIYGKAEAEVKENVK